MVTLTPGFTRQELVNFLIDKGMLLTLGKYTIYGNHCPNIYVVLGCSFMICSLLSGCLMRAGFQADSLESPIVLFDDVSKISVSEVFKDLLGVLENRGPNHPVKISLGKYSFILIAATSE